MADEIDKLRDRVNKEPGSKLFLSLAEQYRNSGRLDEAMEVLKAGIQKQPLFMSARVALGKIYLEKNMAGEAAAEFETVVKAIPENLFAQKKLADIYLAQGEREKAKKALEAVVVLNPMDEQAIASLKELEGPAEATDNVASLLEPTSFSAEISDENAGQAVLAEPVSGAEAAGFNIEEAAAAEAELPVEAETAPEMQIEDQPASSLDGLNEIASEVTEAKDEFDQDGAIEIEDPDAAESAIQNSDFSFTEVPEADMAAEAGEEAVELTDALPGPVLQAETFELPEAELVEEAVELPSAEAEPDEMPAMQTAAYAGPKVINGNTSLEDADALIAAGKFAPAVMIFKRRLEADPSDKLTRQKFEELKMLLKILKKRARVKAGILEGFLAAMEKRKSEFLGSA